MESTYNDCICRNRVQHYFEKKNELSWYPQQRQRYVEKKKMWRKGTNFLWNRPLLKNLPRTYSPSLLVAGTCLETARSLCLMPRRETFPTKSEASPKRVWNSKRNTRQRVEGVISSTNRLIRGHLAIWLNAMLQTEELPAPGKSKRTTPFRGWWWSIIWLINYWFWTVV